MSDAAAGHLRLLVAAALLAAGAWLGTPRAPDAAPLAPPGEPAVARPGPFARLLAPLAPEARALLGLLLWTAPVEWGEPGLPPHPREELARALLDGAADLDGVRIALARWLVGQRAPAEADAERHRAWVSAGLRLLDERLARAPTPALHAALGRLLARPERDVPPDPRRRRVAEQLFGARSDELAIAELRRAGDGGLERRLLADLLIDRGLHVLERYDDVADALDDFQEAQRLLRAAGDERAAELEPHLERLRARQAAARRSGETRS